MRKIGLTIAAAAAVLTSLVAPVNAGCRSVTKIFESDSRTVTQKTKVATIPVPKRALRRAAKAPVPTALVLKAPVPRVAGRKTANGLSS